MAQNPILRVIEDTPAIDRLADPIHDSVNAVMERSSALRTALDGTWLGHPLHPALTDVPVGAWTAGVALDYLSLARQRRGLRRGADVATVVGFVGALGAAIAGLADWSYTRGSPKRVGFVHAIANSTVALLYGASLFARARKRRTAAITLSTAGYGVLMFSSWLGGELAYHYGIGVNPRVRDAKVDVDAAPEGNSQPKGRPVGATDVSP